MVERKRTRKYEEEKEEEEEKGKEMEKGLRVRSNDQG